ncbi:unnamed protein product [Orchesella dallaii]|uniref:26S proteasome non-ATPase regulatory subunit 13 n=1 Tax=Orchesella dallaii TaxID=48710 RepID=A0ABP1PW41_9HEXA
MVRDVSGYLRSKERSADPAMAEKWAKLDELHSKRLWHQLTNQLLTFVKEPSLQKDKLLVELYENFIQEFELRIKTLSFMELCALIVVQYEKPSEAYVFLDNCEKRVSGDPVALALCKITRGQINLEKEQDVKSMKVILEEVEKILRQTDGITEVHGRFYLLQSKFYLEQGNLTEYYKSALKFLGCTPPKDLPLSVQKEHAKNLAVSSLVADGIFNFGELLAHPVLDSLKRTQDEWLVHLMKAFNTGDVNEFEALKKKWSSNKLLAENESKLRTKVTLLAIMEMTFRRSANERQVSFEDVAKVAKLPIDQVELYVMKAIAKGLIVGKIDEVGQKIFMTWVQPRVLDTVQIGTMITRLDEWQRDLEKAQNMMKKDASDILLY